MNANLLGKNIHDFKDPAKILLLADAKQPSSYIRSMADIDRRRHGKGTMYVAAFLDGHVERLNSEQPVKLK